MAKMCVVNTVCGAPRGEARWWFSMKESQVDHMYYALFAELGGPVTFGVACCDDCKNEIERRLEVESDAAMGLAIVNEAKKVMERRDDDDC